MGSVSFSFLLFLSSSFSLSSPLPRAIVLIKQRYLCCIFSIYSIIQVSAVAFMSDISVDDKDKAKNFGMPEYINYYITLF